MNLSTDVHPDSAIVELSPGTAVVFGSVPDGLDLIPFRLLQPEDHLAIVDAIAATSPILNVDGRLPSQFTQPKGLVLLDSDTLDAWRSRITPPPSFGDYFLTTWHVGHLRNQIRWLPSPRNAPSVVLARLDVVVPLLRIQTRLHSVLGLSRDNVRLADQALADARHDEWAELWGDQPTATKVALYEALGAGDMTEGLIESHPMDGVENYRAVRDRFKRQLQVLADAWDEQGPLPDLVRIIEANGEEALLDLYGFLIAHKWWFLHQALGAVRARLAARQDPHELVLLQDITNEMLDSHDEMLRVAGRVLSTINFSRDNWHLRRADQPAYAGLSMERPAWDMMRQQLDAATRKLADAASGKVYPGSDASRASAEPVANGWVDGSGTTRADETPAGTRTCSWCGRHGHDRRSCTVGLNAAACSACGYHGHDQRNCPHL